MADLDHPTVRSGALERVVFAGSLGDALKLGLRIGARAEFATLGEIADIFRIGSRLGEERIRQIQNLLEIAVPRRQPQLLVEHRHAIAHILEGDPQFGLTLRQFVGALFDQPLQPRRRFGALGEQCIALDRMLAEHLDRPAHCGHFVGASGIDDQIAPAAGDHCHAAAEPSEPRDDVASDIEPHDQKGRRQAQRRDGEKNVSSEGLHAQRFGVGAIDLEPREGDELVDRHF